MGERLIESRVIPKTSLKVFHQNVAGLRNKSDELYCHLAQDPPHIICITEHHLKDFELELTCFNGYTLGAKYCRKFFQKEG
jgi:hypothetical protein